VVPGGTPSGGAAPPLVELDAAEPTLADRVAALHERAPGTVVMVRLPLGADPAPLVRDGVGVIHLVATAGQQLAADLPAQIRAVHEALVTAGLRDRVTLIGSVGVRQAEHCAKAIACGLDLVALDLPLWIALQADLAADPMGFPQRMRSDWGTGRLQNLLASWRDQLLEVLGAMGLREVRRLRGELGRTMFQEEMEREAFGEIEGWTPLALDPAAAEPMA
jgi:hypothetical protein